MDFPASEPGGSATTDKKVRSAAASNNEFAFDLYAKLKEGAKNGEGNLFFSPASIETALAMAYASARGQTAAEMRKVLHFTLDIPTTRSGSLSRRVC